MLIAGFDAAVALAPRDQRFASSWEIRSLAPGNGSIEDLRMESPRVTLTNPDWSTQEYDRFKKLPTEAPFLPTAGEAILKSIEGYRARFDNAKLNAVLGLTKLEFQGPDDTWKFPDNVDQHSDGKCNPPDLRELSRRAVLLLRAVGIPSRMATGFKYPMVDDEEKTSLVLVDSQKTWWPEVYLNNTGWLPLVLPLDGERESDSPNLSAIEEMMAASLDSELAVDAKNPDPAESYRKIWCFFLVGFFLIYCYPVYFIVFAPIFSPAGMRAIVSLRAASALIALDGHYRSYGESRRAFAARLPEKLREPMDQLALAFEASKWNECQSLKLNHTLKPLLQIVIWAIPRGLLLLLNGICLRKASTFTSGLLWYLRACHPRFLHQADKPIKNYKKRYET
jgi:hypothetical protein